MTIASAFNEIAVAQGGTASKSGTITGALDALTDALAGSDQPAPQTIEAGVRMLGEHIGGGGSADIGAKVFIKAGENVEDFSFDIWVGDKFTASMNTDIGGVAVAAGVSLYIGAASGRSGTYKIGSAAPQNLVFKTIGVAGYLTCTIPVDTPENTEIIVDGNF